MPSFSGSPTMSGTSDGTSSSPARRISPEAVLEALRNVREGRIFDLGSGWWPGMPMHPTHAPFQLLTYRTPRGMRIQRDRPQMLPPENTVGRT